MNPNLLEIYSTTFENILINISIILPIIHVTELITFSFDCFIFLTHNINDITDNKINIIGKVVGLYRNYDQK